MLRSGSVFLLHVVLLSGQTRGVQVPHRESAEMVTTGKTGVQVWIRTHSEGKGVSAKVRLFPQSSDEALPFISLQVDKHREHLINYIIFLRITPFLPNWFINITSPVINVPLGVFFFGTFLGKKEKEHFLNEQITIIAIYYCFIVRRQIVLIYFSSVTWNRCTR